MPIDKIIEIRNVARIHAYSAKGDVSFRRVNLIYGQNGQGKTSLTAILRSLSTGDAGPISERTTLGQAASSTVQLLVDKKSFGAEVRASAAFIEECLLRPWPGNVRELFAAVKMAVANAKGERWLAADDLPAWIGKRSAATNAVPKDTEPEEPPTDEDPRRVVFLAKHRELGSVERAADAAGVARSTAYRWLKESRKR